MRLPITLALLAALLPGCNLTIAGTASATDGEGSTGSSGTSGSSGTASTSGTPTTGGTDSIGGSSGNATEPVPGTDGTSSTGGTDGASTSSGTDGTSSTGSSGGDNTGGALAPATAAQTCAPNDGPAVEFRLALVASECGAAPESLDIRATVYQAPPLAPGVYPLDGGLGHFSVQDGMNQPVFGTKGTIIIESWTDAGATGHFELITDGMGTYPGFFDMAPLCPSMPMCG